MADFLAPLRAGVYCLPQVSGRGAGLGNELVPWARAWLMAQVLGARCLTPAFGLNPRGYRRLFRSPADDWLRQRALLATLPRVHFGEAEYLAQRAHGAVGDGADAAGAADAAAADGLCAMHRFARFAQAQGLHRRRPLVVTTDGMWGGLVHVRRAFAFVRATLMNSRGSAAALTAQAARLCPERLTVVMHVRRGDFVPAGAADVPASTDPTAWRGRFNTALPLAWFVHTAHALREAFGAALQVLVVSDGRPDELAPLHAALGPALAPRVAGTDASDLLVMAEADLLVCSVSAYSLWAAALSGAPYLWFRPQLQVHEGGWLSLWGHEPAQAADGGATQRALAAQAALGQTRRTEAGGPPGHGTSGRGFALAEGEALPSPLLARLHTRLADRRACGDLVLSGVIR